MLSRHPAWSQLRAHVTSLQTVQWPMVDWACSVCDNCGREEESCEVVHSVWHCLLSGVFPLGVILEASGHSNWYKIDWPHKCIYSVAVGVACYGNIREPVYISCYFSVTRELVWGSLWDVPKHQRRMVPLHSRPTGIASAPEKPCRPWNGSLVSVIVTCTISTHQ